MSCCPPTSSIGLTRSSRLGQPSTQPTRAGRTRLSTPRRGDAERSQLCRLLEQSVERYGDSARLAPRRSELSRLLAGTDQLAKALHLVGQKARRLAVAV